MTESRIEARARRLLVLYLVTPRRNRRRREHLADLLVALGTLDPVALGRAMYAAGFRAEDL